METTLLKLKELNDQCIQLCDELQVLMEEERNCLIHFKSEELQDNNLAKDQSLALLRERREEYRRTRELIADEPSVATVLEEEQRRWERSWSKLMSHAQDSQDFLKHSLRNVDLLLENVRRLFRVHTVYDAKGNRVDGPTSGKVVEGCY